MSDESNSDQKLVVLATFSRSADAHCLRAELENNGIRSRVANEHSTSLLGASWFGPIGAFWVEVLVFESDAEEALIIKNRLQPEANQTEISEWTCSCGEIVDAGFEICWACSSAHPKHGESEGVEESDVT